MIDKIISNKYIRIVLLLLITIVACSPLFIHGIEGHFGQDLGFHLNRIEGIKTELNAGHFPVRMESNWMDGYGYPVSIYYGDLLLYIPALLRMMGIGVVTSYKCFVFLVTFATATITYVCFRKIFDRADIGLVCALIYTTASYRLVNVFIRAAVGEYSAMMFFPLVLYAMYRIYKADKDIGIKEQFVNASLLTLGISGLINTHMLSLEIVGIILIVFCIINIRKTFTKSVLVTYVFTGVETVVVNLFFIVPFVDYFLHESVNIKNTIGNARQIQNSGMHLWEYFSFFRMPFANIEGAGDDRLLVTPGIVCMLIIVATIVMWIRGKANKEMKITTVSVILLLFIASAYFPWDFLAAHTRVGDFLAQVQFPWRYIGIVIVLLTLLGGRIFERITKDKLLAISYIAVAVISLVTVVWFTYEYVKYSELKEYETSADLDSFDMGYIEYLRSDTVREDFTHSISTEGNVNIKLVDRNGTDRTYNVSSQGDSKITLPIVNYKGYVIEDDNGNNIPIYDGVNNLITFDLERSYTGKLYLRFLQPIYWRIAQLISLIGIVVVIAINIIIRRKGKEEK